MGQFFLYILFSSILNYIPITYSALANTHPPAPLKGGIVERWTIMLIFSMFKCNCLLFYLIPLCDSPLRKVRERGVCEGGCRKKILNINGLLYKVYYFNYWSALMNNPAWGVELAVCWISIYFLYFVINLVLLLINSINYEGTVIFPLEWLVLCGGFWAITG